MKTAVAVLIMLVQMVCHVAADDPSPSPSGIESLIDSIPRTYEYLQWRSYSEAQRNGPENAKLAQKIKDDAANCERLRLLLVKGKPLSDYPGLLTLGHIKWKAQRKRYYLMVIASKGEGWGNHPGFICWFDEAYNIDTVDKISEGGF